MNKIKLPNVSRLFAGLCIMIIMLICTAMHASAAMIWVGDSNRNLYTVDTNSMATVHVGYTGSVLLTDIAFDTSGNLWGVDFDTLYSINTTDNIGHLTTVGAGHGGYTNALTFDEDGTLYAAGEDDIYTLDTATGLATILGQTGVGNSGGDLEVDDMGNMYLSTSGSSRLVSIDKTDGSGSLLGNTGLTNLFGLSYTEGQMYGFAGRYMYDIDTTDGTPSNRRYIAGGTSIRYVYGAADRDFGAESVPEPATVALLGIGIVGLAGAGVRRRRKKAVDKR